MSCLKAIFPWNEKKLWWLALEPNQCLLPELHNQFQALPQSVIILKMFFSSFAQSFNFREKRNWLLQRRIQRWSQKRNCMWWWWWLTAEKNRSAEQTWYQGKYVVFHMQKYGMQQERLDWILQPDCYLLLLFCVAIILPEWVWKEIEEQGRTRNENRSIWKQILFSSILLSEGHVPRKK